MNYLMILCAKILNFVLLFNKTLENAKKKNEIKSDKGRFSRKG